MVQTFKWYIHTLTAGPLTLLDQCTFESPSICGMIQTSSDDADWAYTKGTTGAEDHTFLGGCRGQRTLISDSSTQITKKGVSAATTCLILSDIVDAGYFMHFSTKTGNAQESALLESRTLYPKRKTQCLQFFYKMTGSSKDKLVIWAKIDDGTGTVRKMRKIHTFNGIYYVYGWYILPNSCLWTHRKCYAIWPYWLSAQ